MTKIRETKPIPIGAAQRIAEEYGYDQVMVYARRVGDDPEPCGEHVTTYGVTKAHCNDIAKAADWLKYNVFGWKLDKEKSHG